MGANWKRREARKRKFGSQSADDTTDRPLRNNTKLDDLSPSVETIDVPLNTCSQINSLTAGNDSDTVATKPKRFIVFIGPLIQITDQASLLY